MEREEGLGVVLVLENDDIVLTMFRLLFLTVTTLIRDGRGMYFGL